MSTTPASTHPYRGFCGPKDDTPRVYNIHRHLGDPTVADIPLESFNLSFIYKMKSYSIHIQKASIGKGWDWETQYQSGRRDTKEQAIDSARENIKSVN